MSKLQKALQRLRENKAQAEGINNGSDVEERELQKTKRRRSRQWSEEGAVVTQSVKFEVEPLLEQRYAINKQLLLESGLEVSEEHEKKISQQFRRIKRPIMSNAFDLTRMVEGNANVVMIASAMPGSGKTFCAMNLAKSIAQERDVGALLVDADVLKPTISRKLGLADRPGLIDYLLDAEMEIDDVLLKTDYHDIIVLPAGRQHPDATELLASKRMRKLVSLLSDRFRSRAVIVDTPPLLITNEAHVLAENMGQIAFIIEAGVTSHEAVNEALASLNTTKPINAIVNKSRHHDGGGYGASEYYGYGVGYGEEER